MAMRKIGSRVVVVDGCRYRWRVRRSPTYSQAAYAAALTFSVQRDDGGSVLLVVAEGPRPDNWLGQAGAVITPAVVVAAIRRALGAGWQAELAGPVFEMALKPSNEPSAVPELREAAPLGFTGSGFTASEEAHVAPCELMDEATIRFAGAAFHCLKWTDLLRQLGFRFYDSSPERGVYVSGGNNVLVESQGFVTRNGEQGYEWRVTLKQTRRWEGTIKFCSVLLAAFALPQTALVTIANRVFTDRRHLRAQAEAAIVRDFTLDELRDNGVYWEGDGIQFV